MSHAHNQDDGVLFFCRVATSISIFFIMIKMAVMAACVIPGILSACPTVAVSAFSSFIFNSVEISGTEF